MTRRNLFASLGAIAVLFFGGPVLADVEVGPGETVSITMADGGSLDLCETTETTVCSGELLLDTGSLKLGAGATVPDGAAGASGTIYAAFSVTADDSGSEARLDGSAVTISPEALGVLGSTTEDSGSTMQLTVVVMDVTDDAVVATATLLSADASGSDLWVQLGGESGINFPDEAIVETSATTVIPVVLTRGHSYAVKLTLELGATASETGDAFSDFASDDNAISEILFAGWEEIRVTVGPDIADVLARIEAKIDALDDKVEEGFEEVDNRFDAVDAGLAVANAGIMELQNSVAILDTKVDVIDDKVDVINGKLDFALIALDGLRAVMCDLERLVMTPQGQRESDIGVCEDQPGFPFAWPMPAPDHPGNGNGPGDNNGNGPDNNNGNGNNEDPGNGDPEETGGETPPAEVEQEEEEEAATPSLPNGRRFPGRSL